MNNSVGARDLHNALQRGIRSVSISGDVSENVFEDQNFFGHLREVWLNSNGCERSIKELARSCPELHSLFISQRAPLSCESIRQLAAFRKLKFLQLECPAADPVLLASTLPKTLEYLRIEEEYPLADFPRLQFLSVNYCRIDHRFLETLQAPNLERLDFAWVDMPPGSLKAVGRFHNLIELQVYNTSMKPGELQYIRSLEFLETTVHQIYRQKTPYWDNFLKRAETSFKAGKFQDALTNYREIAFSRPSTYLYLQLARCYFELGYIAQGLKSCDRAQLLEPNSAESELLRKQMQTNRNFKL